jgi:phenylalanyl-tRNA synthetase beta chain
LSVLRPTFKSAKIVPVVLPGGQVMSAQGGFFKVGKAKIRGVDSEGMMCSELELGLGDDHTSILILPSKLEKHLGQPLLKFLDQIQP